MNGLRLEDRPGDNSVTFARPDLEFILDDMKIEICTRYALCLIVYIPFSQFSLMMAEQCQTRFEPGAVLPRSSSRDL